MFPLTIEEANWIVKCSDSPPQYSGSIYIDDYDNDATERGSADFESQDDFSDNLSQHNLGTEAQGKDDDSVSSKTMDIEEFLAKSLIKPAEKDKSLSLTQLAEMFHKN